MMYNRYKKGEGAERRENEGKKKNEGESKARLRIGIEE